CLDDRILHGDALAAVAATPAQQEPAQDRDVVMPRDLALTSRASRARPHHRLLGRPAIDAHVEERADRCTDQACVDEKQRRRHDLCLVNRYSRMPAATATFNDSARPGIA